MVQLLASTQESSVIEHHAPQGSWSQLKIQASSSRITLQLNALTPTQKVIMNL
jgi:hypothetical protein